METPHVARKKTSKKKTTQTRQSKATTSSKAKASKSKASKSKVVKKKSTPAGKVTKKSAKRPARKKSAAKTTTRTTDRAVKSSGSKSAKAKSTPQSTAASSSSTGRTKKADTKRAKAGAKAGKEVMGKEANGRSHVQYDAADNRDLSREELRKIKTGLTKKELTFFRQLLLEKRGELIGDVESLQSDARNGGGGISYEHMADVGTDSYEQEFALGLAETERKILHEIDDALERMSEGYYGVCVASGQPIGKPRLEIKPWAKYCIEVAREREKRGLMS
ncbi:TraR/DksA family transcriptional regulator [Phycisphaerales bacterium AB-hyl4]|uniref:TraR/DksA family transcriptional regulator n=1 Tax=Natronomicrosphaera hydrolytica TaxID=3242702 RepID=A0ABV4U8H7_9BACT